MGRSYEELLKSLFMVIRKLPSWSKEGIFTYGRFISCFQAEEWEI
jgi:hypothetical protein